MRAVLFDVDGTLISSGGAGAASWRMAFDDLYGIEAAHGAGALAAGVATGRFDMDALHAAGTDYVLRSLEEELPVPAVTASK